MITKPIKTQNQNKKESKKEQIDSMCSKILEWLQEFREKFGGWWNSITGRLSRQFFSWSLIRADYQRDVRIWVSTMCILIFPKDRNCEICKRTKITRAPCRRRNGEAVLRAVNFGDLITTDHKVPSDNCESRNNHRYAVVGAGSSHSMDPGVSVQKRNFTRNLEKFAKVPGTPRGNQKSLTQAIPWNSAKLVKISLGITARLHHIDRRLMVLRKEQCAE